METAIPSIPQREDASWATMPPATKPPTISQIAMRFLLATTAGSVGRATGAGYARAPMRVRDREASPTPSHRWAVFGAR